VVRDSRHLTEIDGPVLAVAVAERLAGERAERHLELVRRAATLRSAPEKAHLASRMCSWRSTTRASST
jgi:hypothetical protein